MRRDHRPFLVKQFHQRFQKLYVRHILKPQFTGLGPEYQFARPWNVALFGEPIQMGHHASVIADHDARVHLSVWSNKDVQGQITIGDYALICPGVHVISLHRIQIGDNCMLARGAYVTDADWHGVYDRSELGPTAPVTLEDNVWIGDRVTVCKGVTIGTNSVVGAGSVVVQDIPANVVAAGNPARVVKPLDPDTPIKTRAQWYQSYPDLTGALIGLDRQILARNTLWKWLKTLVCPGPRD